jgi:hypothetical protein
MLRDLFSHPFCSQEKHFLRKDLTLNPWMGSGTLILDGWQMMTKYGAIISSSRIEDTENLMSCVLFCVLGVFYLFAGLLCFMFCSSIELSWF